MAHHPFLLCRFEDYSIMDFFSNFRKYFPVRGLFIVHELEISKTDGCFWTIHPFLWKPQQKYGERLNKQKKSSIIAL
jgi:hypothetical protein